MPFGLASVASVFQRIMNNILKDVRSVLVFQDDMLVFGVDGASHDATLDNVLSLFKTH